jgi:hypothetical protein
MKLHSKEQELGQEVVSNFNVRRFLDSNFVSDPTPSDGVKLLLHSAPYVGSKGL